MLLVYKNGEVCISILHEPGHDEYGYEDASERWLPVHGVESIVESLFLHTHTIPRPFSSKRTTQKKEKKIDQNNLIPFRFLCYLVDLGN